jgi:hypothetical protein
VKCLAEAIFHRENTTFSIHSHARIPWSPVSDGYSWDSPVLHKPPTNKHEFFHIPKTMYVHVCVCTI